MKKIVETRDRIAIIVDLLKNHRGKMVTLEWIKKNGEYRKANGRFGVHDGVKHDPIGMKITESKEAMGKVNFTEIKTIRNEKGKIIGNEKAWKTVDLNTLIKAKMNHKELIAL